MKHERSKLLFFLTTISTMLTVLSASIAIPILCRPFYYAHVSLLNLPAQTGWSSAQIHEAYNEMMDYCLFGRPFGTGILRWSESGKAHFEDCAILFRLDFIVLLIGILLLLICLFLYLRGKRPCTPLGFGPAFWSGSTLAGLFIMIAIFAATNFNRAFVLFHTLFFSGKDNWLFDPTTDQIILVLPQIFFRNCAILIVGLLLLTCFILIFSGLHSHKHFSQRP